MHEIFVSVVASFMLINLEIQDSLMLCTEQCKSDLMNYSNYHAIRSQKAGLITDRYIRCSYVESETASSTCTRTGV